MLRNVVRHVAGHVVGYVVRYLVKITGWLEVDEVFADPRPLSLLCAVVAGGGNTMGGSVWAWGPAHICPISLEVFKVSETLRK